MAVVGYDGSVYLCAVLNHLDTITVVNDVTVGDNIPLLIDDEASASTTLFPIRLTTLASFYLSPYLSRHPLAISSCIFAGKLLISLQVTFRCAIT